MKKFMFMGLGLFPGLLIAVALSPPITFESMESKTLEGGPVFNQVAVRFGWSRDIWLMRQSHKGFHEPDWDRLAIVVDKTKTPFEAKFYEFTPGRELGFFENPVPYKARCYACHANGPRAIRWNPDSSVAKPGLVTALRIMLWNLRVKTYGRMDSIAGSDLKEGVPFRSRHPILARELGLKSCKRCHSSDGIRSELRLEHAGTAWFMVQNGFMPPFPFRAGREELRALEKMSAGASAVP